MTSFRQEGTFQKTKRPKKKRKKEKLQKKMLHRFIIKSVNREKGYLLRAKAEGSTPLEYTEKGLSRKLFRRAGSCLEEHFFFVFLKR